VSAVDAFARLPGFTLLAPVESGKPAALVLARATIGNKGGPATQGPPALVTVPYGRGTVAAVLGEGTWQWSLLAPDKQDLTGFYDAFWSNLVRWLALGGDFSPGEQVSLRLSRTSARLGDELTIDVAYKHTPAGGAHPRLELTDTTGATREVALAPLPGRDPRYRATYRPAAAGVYQVALLAPGMTPDRQGRKFSVYEVNLERLQASAVHAPLMALAAETGGAYFEAHQADELAQRLSRHRASLQVPPQLEYIWDQWWVMLGVLLWAGSEWLFRRAAGMI
jgi:hypothetical protein